MSTVCADVIGCHEIVQSGFVQGIPFEFFEAVGKRTRGVWIHDAFVKDEFEAFDFRFSGDDFLLRVAYDFEGIPHWNASSFFQGALKLRLHVVA